MANARSETLEIPKSIRAQVDERDQGLCRVCGRYVGEQRALHHIRYGGDYQGIGGRRAHYVENLLTVGWLFDHDCHGLLHSNKGLWLPLAAEAAVRPAVTVLQLRRWQQASLRRAGVQVRRR